MKKIAFITNSIGFGGAEKMLTLIANELSLKGNDVLIFNLDCINGNYINEKKQYINPEIKIYKVESKSKGFLRHYFRIKNIKRICKEEKIDVIIGFTGFPNFYGSVVGKLLKVPSIISERGDPNRTQGNVGVKTRILDWFINKADGAVFQLEEVKSYYSVNLQKKRNSYPQSNYHKGIR